MTIYNNSIDLQSKTCYNFSVKKAQIECLEKEFSNMANIEELKKMAEENGMEISDEVLESVAGGLYSEEEWTQMTKDERRAAVKESMAIKAAATGEYCKYFDED